MIMHAVVLQNDVKLFSFQNCFRKTDIPEDVGSFFGRDTGSRLYFLLFSNCYVHTRHSMGRGHIGEPIVAEGIRFPLPDARLLRLLRRPGPGKCQGRGHRDREE